MDLQRVKAGRFSLPSLEEKLFSFSSSDIAQSPRFILAYMSHPKHASIHYSESSNLSEIGRVKNEEECTRSFSLWEGNVLFLFITRSNWLIRSSRDVILSRKRSKAFPFRNFYSVKLDRSRVNIEHLSFSWFLLFSVLDHPFSWSIRKNVKRKFIGSLDTFVIFLNKLVKSLKLYHFYLKIIIIIMLNNNE